MIVCTGKRRGSIGIGDISEDVRRLLLADNQTAAIMKTKKQNKRERKVNEVFLYFNFQGYQ